MDKKEKPSTQLVTHVIQIVRDEYLPAKIRMAAVEWLLELAYPDESQINMDAKVRR